MNTSVSNSDYWRYLPATSRTLGFDPVALVQSALARGMVKLVPKPVRVIGPISRQGIWVRKKRQRLYAQGLTSAGKPRPRKKHPEFAGLDEREFRRRWNHKKRDAFLLQGLNTAGLPRVRRISESIRLKIERLKGVGA